MKLTSEMINGTRLYTLDGKEFKEEFMVFVNKKPVAAEVLSLDTKEKWVEVLLPKIEEPEMISNGGIADNRFGEFSYEVSRVTGDIEILLLRK